MAIQKAFLVVCDDCGKRMTEKGRSNMPTIVYTRKRVIEKVMFSDWEEIDGNIYCPKCK